MDPLFVVTQFEIDTKPKEKKTPCYVIYSKGSVIDTFSKYIVFILLFHISSYINALAVQLEFILLGIQKNNTEVIEITQ